jgi:hypothetical protein
MIANKLTVHRSKYNRESVIAWDIVEELSAELKNINTRLDMCLCEEEAFLMNEEHENDLATREYDI